MMPVAELFFPAIRWQEGHGFEAQRDAISAALDLGVGGFIIFGGPSEQVAALTADLRSRARDDLLIGADLERGAGQQFAGATALPPLAAIASLNSIADIREAGAITAREARRLGINWIYAPDCDLDVEPNNPIVGTRSFGANPAQVAAYAREWITACQSEKALACAKHFPGHGRTTTDSHAELPAVNASAQELERFDLEPFRAAAAAGVASMMTAHVSFPALDDSGAPATLSKPILQRLLRDQIGFRGLVVSDALIMQGVLANGEADAAIRGLDAGCDCLLYPEDLTACVKAVEGALSSGRLDGERIEGSIQRRNHWATWAAITEGQLQPLPDESEWARDLADRTVHWISGPVSRLSKPLRVVVVDDDIGGPYPPPSREPFIETLTEGGLTVVRENEERGIESCSTVIALYGDIRAWKGRPGYSAESITRVRELAAKASGPAFVVQFSHPRLAGALGLDVPVLCAWGGEAVMQRAAARVLLRLS
jgi:Beta-glucosidase-related glycosidases